MKTKPKNGKSNPRQNKHSEKNIKSIRNDFPLIGIGASAGGLDALGQFLKNMPKKNGMVLVQEPAPAKFDGMPQSAIEAVIPDVVAPANELPKKSIECVNHHPKTTDITQIRTPQKSNLKKNIILLRERTGHYFSLYKKTTLVRRTERCMSVQQTEKIKDYVRFI